MAYTPPVSEPPVAVDDYHGQPATMVKRGYSTTFYVTGCAYCEAELARGCTFFPSHYANPNHRPHCTCDGCF